MLTSMEPLNGFCTGECEKMNYFTLLLPRFHKQQKNGALKFTEDQLAMLLYQHWKMAEDDDEDDACGKQKKEMDSDMRYLDWDHALVERLGTRRSRYCSRGDFVY